MATCARHNKTQTVFIVHIVTFKRHLLILHHCRLYIIHRPNTVTFHIGAMTTALPHSKQSASIWPGWALFTGTRLLGHVVWCLVYLWRKGAPVSLSSAAGCSLPFSCKSVLEHLLCIHQPRLLPT